VSPALTARRLRQLLRYNSATGTFTRRSDDRLCGTLNKAGYCIIQVEGERHYAHRLAWLYLRDEWPSEIDHINGQRNDNRIGNLRLASRLENMANQSRHRDSTSQFKGVRQNQTGKWFARIQVAGKRLYLGTFDTAEEARAAYGEAAKRLNGDFARQQ
jgi:hypothetical protein